MTQGDGWVHRDFSGGCGVGPSVRGVDVREIVASRIRLGHLVGWVVKGGPAWGTAELLRVKQSELSGV